MTKALLMQKHNEKSKLLQASFSKLISVLTEGMNGVFEEKYLNDVSIA